MAQGLFGLSASAEALWRQFVANTRPRIQNAFDIPLTIDATAFVRQYAEIFDAVSAYARIDDIVPANCYYDGLPNAKRYSALQNLIVPARADLAQATADAVWRRCLRRPELRLLDLGSGDRTLIRAILAHPDRDSVAVVAVALDGSQAMLNAYSEHDQQLGITPFHADLNGPWQQELRQAGHDRFDAVVSQQALHFVPNRRRFYAEIRTLLHDDGVLAFADDFLEKGESPRTFAPLATLRDGYQRVVAARRAWDMTFAGFVAGFIFRRHFLQNDQLTTLDSEMTTIRTSFARAVATPHPHYPEFASIVVWNP